MSLVKFSGTECFSFRLALSVLSGRPVKIDGIRSNDTNPGLKDYEISLLRLIEKVTNGTTIEISYTGTSVLVKPGIISGGSITHDCPLSRSVGYFLEPLLLLAPFSKAPFTLTLRGITTNDEDLSADLLRTVSLPHLQMFGVDGSELRIKKRGAVPLGGGEVQFLCPIIKQAKTINFVAPGRIKRIRGIAHAVRISPQFSHRMIESARSVLNRYIPDIYLYADVYKGEDSGKSPGYALTLLAESTTSAIHSSEVVSVPPSSTTSSPSSEQTTPESLALHAAHSLLVEINRGGCIDRTHQPLVLIMMCLGSEDVGRCRMGALSPRSIQVLRDIKQFFGTSFKIAPVEASLSSSPSTPNAEGGVEGELIVSCYGTGFVNSNRNAA